MGILAGTRRKYIAAAVGGIALAAIIAISSRGGDDPDASVAVTRGSIRQTVSVTGQIQSAQAVELSFQSSGRIARVDAKVGDRVAAGALLASLDNAELNAQLREAEANVLTQQATLQEMEMGGSPQELAIAEADVRSAEQTLQSTYANTYRELSEAYTSAEFALHIRLEPMFNRVGSTDHPSYELTFDVSDYTAEAAAINTRADAEDALRAWRASIDAIATSTDPVTLTAAIADAQVYLQRISAAVNATAALFDGYINVGLDESTEAEYRQQASAARSDISSAIITVNEHDRTIKDDINDLLRSRSEYAYTAQGSTPLALAAQRAQVLAAQAQADRIRALIAKGVIRSPFAGIVTRQDAKVGQSAAANEVLVAVIADQDLEIEANVPEVDIGQVSVGDPVAVTVDALPGQTLAGSVAFIEPGETIVDGVVSFKVTVILASADPRLKNGLTAELDIETERRDGVLLLPQFAIIENDDGTFVRGMDGTDIPVVLGIRGQDGMVEIVSGLNEGDRVQNIGLKGGTR